MSNLSCYNPVAIWIKNRESYVKQIGNVVLRIQSGYHFGENFRGIAEGKGELTDSNWDFILQFKPTIIEINHAASPVSDFLKSVDLFPEPETSLFFEKVKVVSVNSSYITSEQLLSILGKVTLLQGFSCKEATFTEEEWVKITAELRRLNLRAVISSDNIFRHLLNKYDVELLVIPTGISLETIESSQTEYVTITSLFVEGLENGIDGEAEKFFELLPRKFPRVSTLVFDWSLVDTFTLFDKRTEDVIATVASIFRRMNFEALAITFYSPCEDTKQAVEQISRYLKGQLPNVQLFKYSTKGFKSAETNLSIITAGHSTTKLDLIKRAFVDGMTSLPDLSRILPLITNEDVPSLDSTVMDFGGLNRDAVKKLFEDKQKERNAEN
ncbi:unnamed protein product [Auanema sp. JU1783]|nr:unnamed protein product [Auanema sp. JU1783]